MDEPTNETPGTIPLGPHEGQAPVESPVAPEHLGQTRTGVTISHRALWIAGGVALALVVLAGSFGSGVFVGTRMGSISGRDARAGMMRQLPRGGADGWRGRVPPQGQMPQGQTPPGWDNDDNDRSDDGSQGWRGGPGHRGYPRGQMPTATPNL